jgi:hypothetical protein
METERQADYVEGGKEMFGMQDSPAGKANHKVSPAGQDSAVSDQAFTEVETAKLVAARERYLSGKMNEWSDDYKRLKFARWLYEQGRISG